MGIFLDTHPAQGRLVDRSSQTPEPRQPKRRSVPAIRTGTGQGRLFRRAEEELPFKAHGEKRAVTVVKVGRGGKLAGGGGRLALKPIKIALTPAQVEVLKPGKLLGCGFFGCAYERTDDPKLVVKFTRDFTDIYGLQQGRGYRLVAQMRNAWKLRGRDIWAVTVERLQPVPEPFGRLFTTLGMNVVGPWAQHTWNSHPDAGNTFYKLPPAAYAELDAACAQIAYPNTSVMQFCRNVGTQMYEVHEYLGRRKVRLVDFHSGNVGYDPANKRWKVLDVGFSRTPMPTVDELASVQPERAHIWEV